MQESAATQLLRSELQHERQVGSQLLEKVQVQQRQIAGQQNSLQAAHELR